MKLYSVIKKSVLAIMVLCIFACVFTGCRTVSVVTMDEMYINDNGELILSYSDGSEQNLGVVVGSDGKDGEDGRDGEDGKDGTGGNVTIIGGADDATDSVYAVTQGLQSAVDVIATFGEGERDKPDEYYISQGSGVIYKLDKATGDAFIITNYHVVYDNDVEENNGISKDIDIYLYGYELAGKEISAEYVGGSINYDIAVLRVEDSELLRNAQVKEVTVADSALALVGEAAIAIGNPEGMGISATYGIISVDSEYITLEPIDGSTSIDYRVMRVDTPVNLGNSGGGLFNSTGELIGIVNAKRDSVENMGYAIPSNLAIAAANNIIDNCFEKECDCVQRVLLGIMLQIVDSYTEYDETTGILRIHETVQVQSIMDEETGKYLKVGDIVKSVSRNGGDALDVYRQYQILDFMLDARKGDIITLNVLRDGMEVPVSIAIEERHLNDY
ncbi:MAG: trypsin-like peptidase domain-containing protein [Lachnospiraceae bacterium]|nr:trypsin-like peptidase domain-containing protein [Lachnospiraceae bacterium]